MRYLLVAFLMVFSTSCMAVAQDPTALPKKVIEQHDAKKAEQHHHHHHIK